MGGWCQISVSRKRIWSKKVFWEKKVCTFFLVGFGFTSLLLHDCHQMLQKGVPKNPIKIGFFWHTLLLDAEETEKRRKIKERPKKRLHPKNGGPSKRAGSSSTFFPKNRVFQNSLKPLFLQRFPKKWVATIFFQKGYVTMRTLLEGQKKMITFCCLLDRNV